MPKPDILDQSATRVEVDQRSRDARLRLEYVERLLVVRPLARQSLLRRFLRCLRSRARIGGMIAIASAGRASPKGKPSESGGGGGDTLSAALFGAPHCPRGARIGPGRSDPTLTPNPVPCFKAWHHRCGRET
jgi:hypothetical protein